MITLIVLFGSYGLLMILSYTGILFRDRTKRELALYAMFIFLIFFGLSHFYKQDELVLMLPDFVPFRMTIIYLTGVIEIILAFGLLIPATRRWSGILLAIYFAAILPANIYKAMHEIEISGTLSSSVMSWVRLFFQPIFIVWAFICSKPPTNLMLEKKPNAFHPNNELEA